MAKMLINTFVLLLFLQQSIIARSQELISTVALSAATLLGEMEGKPNVSTLKKIKKVNLGDFPNYSVMIPLKYVPSTPQELVDDNNSYEKVSVTKSGKFIVTAPKGFGILTVVQEMDLPILTITLDEAQSDFEFLDPNQSKICKDYIQFSTGGKTGSNSEKVCGKVSRDNYDFKPSDLLGPRAFKSPKGKVIVLFHFSDTSDSFPLLKMSAETTGEEIHGNNDNKSIYKMEVVFTAYKDCNLQLDTDGENVFMPCENSSSSKEENDTCINSNLFCDDNINCGFKSSSFASDENNCLVSNTTEFPTKSKKSISSSYGVLSTFFTKMWKEGEKRILSISQREKPSLIENSSFGKLLFHAAPTSDSDRHTHSNHEGEDFEGIHFPTASGIILLIILSIVIVMSLSIVIRFCCFRCVGTPHSSNLLTTNNSDHITTSNSNAMYGAIPFPLVPRITETQSSNNFVNTFRNTFKKDVGADKPPSYDELFPSSLVDNKFDDIRSGFNEVGNTNALPAAILDVDLTENSNQDSVPENSHLHSSESAHSIWNNYNLRR